MFNENTEDHINALIAKRWAAEPLSTEDTVTLDRWIVSHASEYDRMCQLSPRPSTLMPNVERAWANFKTATFKQRKPSVIKLKPLQRRLVAAATLVVLFAGYLFYKSNVGASTQWNQLQAQNEVKTFTLPDQSIITLNKNSQVEYASDFTKNRNLKLTGEAFFEVQHDKKHPFSITTENATITVLGTSFNVYTSAGETNVSVKTGKVSLKNKESEVFITTGQQGIASNKLGLSVNQMQDSYYLAWKEHKVQFNNTLLTDALPNLEKYYNCRIYIKDSNSKCKITTTFTSETLMQALQEIKLLTHCEYQIKGNVVEIWNLQCTSNSHE